MRWCGIVSRYGFRTCPRIDFVCSNDLFQAREEIDSMGQPVPTTILPSSHSSSAIFEETDKPDETGHLEECSAEFTISASDLPDCTSCNLVISCGGDVHDSVSGSHDSIDVVDRITESVSVIVMPPTSAPLCEMLDEGFEEDGSNSTNCSSVTGVQSPPLLPASPKMASQQKQHRSSTSINTNARIAPKSRPIQQPAKSVSTTASQTRFSYQSGTKSSSMKIAQASATKMTEARSSTASSRRPSISGSVDQGSRPSLTGNTSKSRTTPAAPKNERAPATYQSRRPSSLQSKAAVRPEVRTSTAPNATAAVMAPTKCSMAKTRIQLVPPTRPPLRQRAAASNGASCSSSTSGSDSEQRGPKHPPFRRRLPSSTAKNGPAKEQTTVKRALPAKEKVQHTSVLTVAPRASVSSFRPFNVRKSNAAPIA